MLKNNNQPVIKRLYRRMLKENRIRNGVALIAIILSTFMFTSIFSMGFSLVKNVNQMQLRQQGSKASLYLSNPTNEQMETAKKIGAINAVGLRIMAGEAADEKKEYYYDIAYYDETEFQDNLTPAINDVVGSYPTKKNEVMLSNMILTSLGNESPKLNDQVTLLMNDKKETFVLSGYYTSYSMANPVLVSKAYVDNLGAKQSNAGVMSISCKEGRNDEATDALVKQIKLNQDQMWDGSYDSQTENKETRGIMIIGMCLISLLVVASGYLLIYNVMYISVAKDIRFFGMLKTIGTSPAQIQSLVKKQTAYLALIGIPIGVALGSLASFAVVPLAMRMVDNGREGALSSAVDFNIYIYLFAVAFSYITVWMSARKPAKIASKVSPVEAMKYQAGQGEKIKNYKTKKASSKGKIRRMAVRNVFREKKKSSLVFASLFLGTMTFICINTFIQSVDTKNYLAQYFYNDYVLYGDNDLSGEEVKKEQKGSTIVDVAKKIEAMDGMEYVRVNKIANVNLKFDEKFYAPFLDSAVKTVVGDQELARKQMVDGYNNPKEGEDTYSTFVISMDRTQMENYNARSTQKIDLDRFEKGEICYIGYVDDEAGANALMGKSMTLINDKTKEESSIEIGCVPYGRNRDGLNVSGLWIKMGAPELIIVSDAFMDQHFPDAKGYNVVADAKKGQEKYTCPEIEKLVKDSPVISESVIKSVEGKTFKKSMMSITVVGDGISIILILIGLINFINVMLTGVYTRSNELAVLESVGMTKKQIQKMLVLEGVVYGIITIVLILTLGSGMVYGVGIVSRVVADYAVAKYPGVLVAVLSLVIMGICMLVPKMVYKEIAKKTVTERLRAL